MTANVGKHIEMRGATYWIRWRVPVEFKDVEPRKEINRSLKTRDPDEAEALCSQAKLALLHHWKAQKAGKAADTRQVFDASIDLLRGWGMSFSPMSALIDGPIDDLLERLEKVANLNPQSVGVAAALGAVELPDATLEEMAERMPSLKETEIRAKNHRQRREWTNNFKRAATVFTNEIGGRTVLTITEQDAANYEGFWKTKARSGEVTANYANKQLRYVRQMIDAHFEDIKLPKSKRMNVFHGAAVQKLSYDPADEDRRKLPLPEGWIRQRLVQDRVLEGLNQQASDVAIITACTGARASEIYDLSPEDIFLEHEIAHVRVRTVIEGEDRREVKNRSSQRHVVLQGPALEAMRRNPHGFSQYRGKASFSGSVNGYLRDNRLFPDVPKDFDGNYVISGLRHSFEDRMNAAKLPNEERAFLMGHSVGRVRGRPVYGSGLELPLRSLLQEMVAIGNADWAPRPRPILEAEIERLLKEQGHQLG